MIDELAAAAARELRGTITSDLDAGLLELYADHRRRRRKLAAATAAAAVAIVLGLGWWGANSLSREAPVNPSTPSTTHGTGRPQICFGSVRCLGPVTDRFALIRPVTWHVPDG